VHDAIIATPTKYPNRVIYGYQGPGLEQIDSTPALPGFLEIACHGGEGVVTPFVDPFEPVTRTPQDLIAFIHSLPQFHGQPIRLLICEAAKGSDSTAQRVADALGQAVAAPASPVYACDLTTADGSHWCFLTPRTIPHE
jgi:hypothetical protein